MTAITPDEQHFLGVLNETFFGIADSGNMFMETAEDWGRTKIQRLARSLERKGFLDVYRSKQGTPDPWIYQAKTFKES